MDIETIKSKFPQDLRNEIDYWLDLYEEPVGPVEDFYQATMDIDESDQCLPFWRPHLREFWIELGVYRPISDEQLAEMVVVSSSGRRVKKHDFILRGQKYIFDKHPDFHFS